MPIPNLRVVRVTACILLAPDSVTLTLFGNVVIGGIATVRQGSAY